MSMEFVMAVGNNDTDGAPAADRCVRVRSLSYLPPMFECCGCYVSVESLGIKCSDDIPESSGSVIEVELIGGELRRKLPNSVSPRLLSGQSPTVVTDVDMWPSAGYGQGQAADDATVRRPSVALFPASWTSFVRPARDRLEQNIELVVDVAPGANVNANSVGGLTTDAGRCSRMKANGCLARLRTTRAVQPGEELAAWYSDHVARLIGVPILSPMNIRGSRCYACSYCSACFRHPNPLKSHMMYSCEVAAAAAATRECYGAHLSPLSQTQPPAVPSAAPHSLNIPHWSRGSRSADAAAVLLPTSRVNAPSDDLTLPVAVASTGFDSGMMHPFLTRATVACADNVVPSINTASWIKSRSPNTQRPFDEVGFSRQKQQQQPPTVQFWRNFDEMLPPADSFANGKSFREKIQKVCSPWLQFAATSPQEADHGASTSRYWNVDGQSAVHLCMSEERRQPDVWRLSAADHSWNRSLWSEMESNQSHSNNRRDGTEFNRLTANSELLHVTQSAPASSEDFRQRKNVELRGSDTSPLPLSAAADSAMAAAKSSSRSSSTSSSSASSSPCPSPGPLASASDRRGRHQRAGAMTHRCVHCGKLYSRRYGLTIHLRTHSGDKPLECPVCRRPFGDPSNLNKHVRLHAAAAAAAMAGGTEGIRVDGKLATAAALQAIKDSPYRCRHCGKVLVRRRDLERHIRSRHPSALVVADAGAVAPRARSGILQTVASVA